MARAAGSADRAAVHLGVSQSWGCPAQDITKSWSKQAGEACGNEPHLQTSTECRPRRLRQNGNILSLIT
jgi:hypothetical protein